MLTSSNIEIFIWERSKKQLKNYFRKSIPASFVHLQDFKTLCLKVWAPEMLKTILAIFHEDGWSG